MKTLLITIDFFPQTGGVARYLAGYVALHKADILAPCAGKDGGAGVIRRKLFWGGWPKWLPFLFWGIFYGWRYEHIVISHILPAGYVALLLGRPYTVILHGLDIILASKNFWKKFFAGLILAHAKEIVVNSHATGALLERKFGKKYKFSVEYPKIFSLSAPSADFRAEKGLIGKKIILSLGRLVKRKGQERIIRLMPEILQSVPEAVLVIAGDGPEKDGLRLTAHGLRLQNEVIFLGKIADTELSNLYSSCDVFVMPSESSDGDWEGFGMVCLEAAYFGKPVIVSDTGGLPEAVENGVTGYVVKSDKELEEKIIMLLKNEETAKRMGEAGRERVRGGFLILK